MAGKSYIVLGTGRQGLAAAFDLALNGDADRITLADIALPSARTGEQRLRKLLKIRGAPAPRFHSIAVDGRRESELFKRIRGHDGVVSALPSSLHLAAARASIAARAHYVDLGGRFDLTQEILRLDRPAQKMGVALVPDCGVAPGLCNALASQGIQRLESVQEVKILYGCLPEHPLPPPGFNQDEPIEELLHLCHGTTNVLRNGQVTQIQNFSDLEIASFDAPVGSLEAFVTGGGTSTAPWTHEGRVRTYVFKTLHPPGRFEKLLVFKQMGLLEETPISVDGQGVVPRHVFLSLVKSKSSLPAVGHRLILRVTVRGEHRGQPVEIAYDLLEHEDPHTGFSAVQRTAGFSAAAALEMVVTGGVRVRGVSPIERSFPTPTYLEAIQKRGLRIRETGPRPI